MMKPSPRIQVSFVFSALLCANVPSGWAAPIPSSEIEARPAHTIRVRLDETLPKVQIRGFDLRFAEGARGTDRAYRWHVRTKVSRMSDWTFACKGTRILAVRKDVPRGTSVDPVVLQSPAMIRTPAGFLSFEGRPYREEIRIHSRGTSCEIVNAVDLEKYLDGLVNAEFSSQWSEEAVAAQVVAARTYALFQMNQARRNPYSTFDLDATIRDQVYDGSVKEDFRASKAVARTRGIALVVKKGSELQPIKAFYHSTCGGKTELPGAVWGRPFPGFQKRVQCGFCYHSPRFEWDTEFSSEEIADSMLRGAQRDGIPRGWPAGALTVMKTGKLIGLSPLGDSASGRVSTLTTYWRPAGKGGVQVQIPVRGALFRTWVGGLKIRSTQFRVMPKLTRGTSALRFQFLGRGNGHGVGMCQWGAKVMGERGFKMNQILARYYPGAAPRKLW